VKLSQRARYVLLAVTGAVLIVAMVFQLRSGSGGGEGSRGVLGPTPGPDASGDTYVEEKRRYLETLADSQSQDDVAALISFAKYVAAPDVQQVLGPMEPTFVWVKFPGSEAEPIAVTSTIAGAVADRAAELRAAVDAEIKELETQEQTPELAGLIQTRKQELGQLGADCGCVFALSVEDAQPTELRKLAERPSVRLVDVPDPPSNDLEGWELTPFVPR
jgi:hypothetical protein